MSKRHTEILLTFWLFPLPSKQPLWSFDGRDVVEPWHFVILQKIMLFRPIEFDWSSIVSQLWKFWLANIPDTYQSYCLIFGFSPKMRVFFIFQWLIVKKYFFKTTSLKTVGISATFSFTTSSSSIDRNNSKTHLTSIGSSCHSIHSFSPAPIDAYHKKKYPDRTENMKFLPIALAAFAVGADALLTNPVKNVQKVQV